MFCQHCGAENKIEDAQKAFSITNTGQTGIWGESTGVNGNGIVGVAKNGGGSYGVYGKSTAGVGVVGSHSLGANVLNRPMTLKGYNVRIVR